MRCLCAREFRRGCCPARCCRRRLYRAKRRICNRCCGNRRFF